MKLNTTVLFLTVFLVFSGAAVAQGQAQPNATDLCTKVQGYYASIGDYRASFVQTTAHKLFQGKLQRSYGSVSFKKGGMMRWEYRRPEEKLFIYDGSTLWVYEPLVPQVLTGSADAERLKKSLAFLTGEGKLLDEYSAKVLDARKQGFEGRGYVLALRPKAKNAPFKAVEIYISSKDFHVERSVVVDHEDNRNRLDFSEVKTNLGMDAKEFTFTPPPGVPVIKP
ncbi:MAG: outer membrane lipoprotein chaperone LolA [Myxococcota bacterium]|nr:outer membrane lipoprotein chaperone LolA [Myxococcota bacterium]